MSAILVVEDSAIIREPMARLLRAEGYDVSCAANGVEAMELLATRPVDLVLLDVMMPKMSGIALLEKMRGDEKWKGIAVIAMTGVLDSGRLARLRELGVKSILAKGGFHFEALMNEIRGSAAPLAH